MKRLLTIARVLLLAGLLIGPGWACCCGPDENRCDAPPDPLGATIERVRQAWDAQVRLGQTQAPQICAPSQDDGCVCWKPRQPDPTLPSALVSPFFEALCVEPTLTIVIDPPRRVVPVRQVVLAPPPLRPPIEGDAWSIDLLPLPPPVRA